MIYGFGLQDVFTVFCATVCTGLVWALVQRWGDLKHKSTPQSTGQSATRQNMLWFDFDEHGEFLFANEAGDALLRDLGIEGADWRRFRASMLNRFPHLPSRLAASSKPGYATFDADAAADPAQIGIETHANGATLHVFPGRNADLSLTSDAHRAFSSLADLEIMRASGQDAPYPVWYTDASGTVAWHNRAYQTLDDSIERAGGDLHEHLFHLPDPLALDRIDRVSLRDESSGHIHWFNVTSRAFGTGTLHFAQDIKAVIDAEAAQRNFVQTLAKTFAHLSTGLAIFDRNRQLVLFNPALIDLTHLPPEFLSARPNLFSIFDELRNKQIMPEPKSYASWRDRIGEVISAARDGNFCETWSLASGQTYRITGRPHPDGAIAFLFEDISAEVSLARKFRAETEVTQSALNALPDSIAIFSAAGVLVQCNEPLMREWDLPQSTDDTQLSITDVTRLLQKKCRPSPIWGDIPRHPERSHRRCVTCGS